MTNKYSFAIGFFLLLTSIIASGQKSSFNGSSITPHGKLRALVLFVEVDWQNYPHLDPYPAGTNPRWPSGQFPDWKDSLFDVNSATTQSYGLSKYYDEMSFGSYDILGDYYQNLITIPDSELVDYTIDTIVQPGFDPIIVDSSFKNGMIYKYLRKYYGSSPLYTQSSLPLSSFDYWTVYTHTDSVYLPKVPLPDSKIDHLMILVRNYPTFGNQEAGHSVPFTFGPIFQTSTSTYSMFSPGGGFPLQITAHEYGHLLFGDNHYHTVGAGAGHWTFIHKTGGYSAMSSAGDMLTQTANAWDRRRLGYKHPNNSFYISARAANGSTELNADLSEYKLDSLNPSGEYVLRDFWTYGDALRIKLPYLRYNDSLISEQWLWIENRQHSSSPYGWNSKSDEGMYTYIQVGNEALDKNALAANYLEFFPSIGNYDLIVDTSVFDLEKLFVYDSLANPLSGHHHLMQVPFDKNGNNVISRGESVWAKRLVMNGTPLQSAQYANISNTTSGTDLDAYKPNSGRSKIGIGHNPTASPKLTFPVFQGPVDSLIYYARNRVVHLNGISVEVLEQRANGDIKVKVRFDDYNITQNVRWCAETIMLHEKVLVDSGVTVTIDRGLMPQRNNNPITINGKKAFSSPTTFVMQPGSYFELKESSNLKIINKSVFDLQGGILRVKDGSEIYVDASSKLIVDNLSQLQVFSGGKIKIDGQLIIKSDSGTARLSVGNYIGSTPATNQAVLEINGSLTFDNCAWKHIKNEGKYVINGSVSIAPNYDVELVGNSNSTTLLDLNTHLDLSAAKDVILKEAHIEGGSIKAENNRIHLFDLKTSTNYELNQADDLDVEYVDFMNIAGAALSVTGHSALKKARIKDCDFNGFLRGTEINNVPDITITNTSYQDASADAAITVKNSGIVAYSGDITLFGNQSVGVKLDHVSGFYMGGNATTVQADTGIKATESLVFIRNGATIENCQYGVAIDGTFIQTGSSPVRGYYTSMLTVGDDGCGTIINNDKKGVFTCNTLMNVDAALHSLYAATINGNVVTLPTNINPNHFYGNGQFDFKLSYTHDNPPAIIRAQGNFWNNQSPTTEVKGCTYCHSGDCASLTFDEVPTSACNQSGSVCSVCNTNNKQWTNGTFNNLVLQNFISNYNNFIANDNGGNRSAFDTLAMLNMYQGLDTNENPQWYVYYPPQNDYIAVPEDVADMIQVAKVLYNTGISYSSARLKPQQTPDLLLEFYTDRELIFELLPNPAQYRTTVNIKQRDLRWYQCKVYNSQGKEVLYIDRFRDRVELDLSHLGKMGMYIVEVMSIDGSKRSVQKLIVEK
jgi:hypothetical protein